MERTPTFRQVLAALVAAIIALAASALPAQAQEAGAPSDNPVMVILDASGSMVNNDAGGQTRIDAARDAVHRFVDGVDDGTSLGLLTYGGNTGSTEAEREAGCRDITLVAPPGGADPGTLKAHIDSLEARGYTPIGDSLIQSAEQLPSGGTIVLVSDGIATCTPPPVCEVAADLAARGVDLIINTVGFNVDDAARAELQCIADVAGGTYADASDADSLAAELRAASTRTYRAYESDLENIAGGDSRSTATEVPRDVTEFSTSLLTTGTGNEGWVSHFRTPVAQGERVIISATTTQSPSINNWLGGGFVFGVRADESSCQLDANGVGQTAVNNYLTATLYSQVVGGDCDVEDLGFRISRGGSWKSGDDVDVDVTVTRLGIPDMEGQPAPVEEVSDPPVVAAQGDATEATAGTWFTTATELTAGETLLLDIVPGETHFFRLPVEHGQRLIGAVTPVAESDDFTDLGPGDNIKITAYNEARAIVPLNYGNARIIADRTTDFGYEAPVLFANRYGGTDARGSADGTVADTWQDGDQYLTVRYDRLFSREDIDAQTQLPVLSYTLTADAVGDPVPAPTFTPVTADSSATPSSPTEEPAPTDAADQAADTDDDSGGINPLVWAGLVVVAVIGGAAAFALTRGRRN